MCEEKQTVIVKARCPTEGCQNYTYLEIPTELNDTIECKVCGKTTPARDWLS